MSGPAAPAIHRWGTGSAIAFGALAVAWFFLAAVPDAIDAPEQYPAPRPSRYANPSS